MSLGNVYFSQGKLELAIEEYKKALTEIDNVEDIFTNIAFEYENLGDYAKAIEYLKKALDLNIENEAVIYELSFCYELSNSTSESISF